MFAAAAGPQLLNSSSRHLRRRPCSVLRTTSNFRRAVGMDVPAEGTDAAALKRPCLHGAPHGMAVRSSAAGQDCATTAEAPAEQTPSAATTSAEAGNSSPQDFSHLGRTLEACRIPPPVPPLGMRVMHFLVPEPGGQAPQVLASLLGTPQVR